MKQHIDTAPVWEAYRQEDECPLCRLQTKLEADNAEYFLGESVMDPNQRIEVNDKGFCGRHMKRMYDAGNRLGLALMTHTYMKRTLEKLEANARRVRELAQAEAGRAALQRLIAGKNAGMDGEIAELRAFEGQCAMCERIRAGMQRYIHTLIYMYGREEEFRTAFAGSKGMCLNHYADALERARGELRGKSLQRFVDDLTQIEMRNLERIRSEVEWFTLKFDYRNEDRPWGSSRDALPRAINKLRGETII